MLRTARELPAARLESVSPQALDAVLAGIVVQYPRYREAWAAELAWLDAFQRLSSQKQEPKEASTIEAPVDELLANHWC